jgi:4a-hydroxytetrahydrobiopterin dehydratase
MSEDLAQKDCVPCKGGVPPLGREEIARLLGEVSRWALKGDHKIFRRFTFADFAEAWALVGRVAELAEQQGHHPDIAFGWGYAEFTIWTHAIDGLTESDFILAAKIDELV